ncbi:hypothetical protein FRX31_021163, partial [Thalictrum thalictroides]
MASPSSSKLVAPAPPFQHDEESSSQGFTFNGFPQLFLLFLFLSVLYTVMRYKGGCDESNEVIHGDIEGGELGVQHRAQIAEQIRHSNLLMQILRNSQHRVEA